MVVFKCIDSFEHIEITNKSLVVCDIDDTLLKYKIDWTQFFNKYMEENKDGDTMRAKDYADLNWYRYTSYNKPFLIDKEGFLNLMKKIEQTNSTLIFLTARHKDSHLFTIENFKDIDIPYWKYDIHYSYTYPKGAYLRDIVHVEQKYSFLDYEKIIFIDDLVNNIMTMLTYMPYVDCYHFKRK